MTLAVLCISEAYLWLNDSVLASYIVPRLFSYCYQWYYLLFSYVVISIEQQLNYYDVKHQMIKNQGYPVHYCPVLLDV